MRAAAEAAQLNRVTEALEGGDNEESASDTVDSGVIEASGDL